MLPKVIQQVLQQGLAAGRAKQELTRQVQDASSVVPPLLDVVPDTHGHTHRVHAHSLLQSRLIVRRDILVRVDIYHSSVRSGLVTCPILGRVRILCLGRDAVLYDVLPSRKLCQQRTWQPCLNGTA